MSLDSPFERTPSINVKVGRAKDPFRRKNLLIVLEVTPFLNDQEAAEIASSGHTKAGISSIVTGKEDSVVVTNGSSESYGHDDALIVAEQLLAIRGLEVAQITPLNGITDRYVLRDGKLTLPPLPSYVY